MQHGMQDRDMVIVTGYHEAEEILSRSNEFVVAGAKPESVPFLEGTLIALDGADHLARRRLHAKLVRPAQLERYQRVLEDGFEAFMAPYRDASPTDEATFDLVELGRRLFYPVTAVMIGLDEVTSATVTADLDRLVVRIVDGTTVEFSTQDHAEVLRLGLEAKEEFRRRFFQPGLDRRVAERSSGPDGDAGTSDLIAAMVDDQWPDVDAELILREAILFLAGSVNNPVAILAWSLAELTSWLAAHPDRARDVADEGFLRRVVDETLRLHRTGNPLIMRRAAVDADLTSTGRRFAAGEWIGIHLGKASRDPDAFGADADVFDPDRAAPETTKPYGLAYGSGPHVCIGRPLISPDSRATQLVGLEVEALRLLLSAGVRMHPTLPPTPAPHGGDRFATFPVVAGPSGTGVPDRAA